MLPIKKTCFKFPNQNRYKVFMCTKYLANILLCCDFYKKKKKVKFHWPLNLVKFSHGGRTGIYFAFVENQRFGIILLFQKSVFVVSYHSNVWLFFGHYNEDFFFLRHSDQREKVALMSLIQTNNDFYFVFKCQTLREHCKIKQQVSPGNWGFLWLSRG